MPVTPEDVVRNVWATHSDSCAPIFRYCTFCIKRSPRESSAIAVPGCGTMLSAGTVYVVWETLVAAPSVPPAPQLGPAVNFLTSHANTVCDSETK